jgi:hypothetical protein
MRDHMDFILNEFSVEAGFLSENRLRTEISKKLTALNKLMRIN